MPTKYAKSHETFRGISSLSPAALLKFRRRLVKWFEKKGRDLPWRRTRDPYAILVSELMLQQTQVATVIPYYERWLKRFPDFASLARADESSVLAHWQGLGYYARARNLHRAARAIVEEHQNRFPQEPEEIRTLPGVGRYTAGAVATFAFDRSTPIVDANIARLLARLFDVQEPVDSTSGQERLWQIAALLQPRTGAGRFNGALMELGALVCTPRTPDCAQCPVAEFCRSDDPESLPRKKPRRKTIQLIERCAFIPSHDRTKILLEHQTGARWRGMWKLPSLEPSEDQTLTPLYSATYPFTHHRVSLSVFRASVPGMLGKAQRWHAIASLEDIPIPSPHRRAIRALIS